MPPAASSLLYTSPLPVSHNLSSQFYNFMQNHVVANSRLPSSLSSINSANQSGQQKQVSSISSFSQLRSPVVACTTVSQNCIAGGLHQIRPLYVFPTTPSLSPFLPFPTHSPTSQAVSAYDHSQPAEPESRPVRRRGWSHGRRACSAGRKVGYVEC